VLVLQVAEFLNELLFKMAFGGGHESLGAWSRRQLAEDAGPSLVSRPRCAPRSLCPFVVISLLAGGGEHR
jgi:hypothetical protein